MLLKKMLLLMRAGVSTTCVAGLTNVWVVSHGIHRIGWIYPVVVAISI